MQTANVHPAFANILRVMSGDAQRAANDAALQKFRVTVSGADLHETFCGIFPSANAAYNAGADRASEAPCGITVRRLA